MSIFKTIIASAFALTVTGSGALAQYPERPVTLIVPFEAGGTTDLLGRIVADHLSEALGSPVVVENRGGGGGTIGAAVVAQAAPDGYMLLLATSGTHSINPNLRQVNYDPIEDFEPVSLAVETPVLVVVHPGVEAQSLEDLAELARQDPGSLNFASAGNGSTSHLAGELFNQLSETELVHIPYPGAGPAMNDVLAGRVQVFMNNMPPFVPHVESGAMRALAIASEERSTILPDVPTAAESGLPDFVVAGWFGVVAPSGTEPEIVERLHAAMAEMNGSERVQELLRNVGSEVSVSESPQAFADYIAEELVRWRSVVEQAGARVD